MKGIIIWHNFQTIFPDQTYSCVGCQSRDGHSWCSVKHCPGCGYLGGELSGG